MPGWCLTSDHTYKRVFPTQMADLRKPELKKIKTNKVTSTSLSSLRHKATQAELKQPAVLAQRQQRTSCSRSLARSILPPLSHLPTVARSEHTPKKSPPPLTKKINIF